MNDFTSLLYIIFIKISFYATFAHFQNKKKKHNQTNKQILPTSNKWKGIKPLRILVPHGELKWYILRYVIFFWLSFFYNKIRKTWWYASAHSIDYQTFIAQFREKILETIKLLSFNL